MLIFFYKIIFINKIYSNEQWLLITSEILYPSKALIHIPVAIRWLDIAKFTKFSVLSVWFFAFFSLYSFTLENLWAMSKMISEEGGAKWLRRCNPFEEMMDKIQSGAGFMLTSYCLTLNSRQPLLERDVKTALQWLRRWVQIPWNICRPMEVREPILFWPASAAWKLDNGRGLQFHWNGA